MKRTRGPQAAASDSQATTLPAIPRSSSQGSFEHAKFDACGGGSLAGCEGATNARPGGRKPSPPTHSQDAPARSARAGLEATPVDRRRIALVHVAKSRLAMSEEAYRAMLMATAGVRSSKDLTETGFRAVMRRFEQLGFAPASISEVPGDDRRPGMASSAQCAYIRSLWTAWFGRPDARALGRWMEDRFHCSDLRFADVVTAQKAIEGLRAMVARGKSRASGATKE
jgi:Protein of unknown function (DUF1018)